MPDRVQEAEATRSPREIGLSSLAHASSYAQNVGSATDRVAELLRTSRIEEANDLFAQALDALNVLVFTIDSATHLLDAEIQTQCPAAQHEAQAWVTRLTEAQQNQDWIRVADVLEFDVRPSLDAWSDAIQAIPGVVEQ
jgi:hypothetical protein